MKKRTVMIITALVAAFSLLTLTAFAAAPTYEGYEAFKALAKEKGDMNLHEENGTIKSSFTLVDNGETLTNLDAKMKSEGLNQDGSGLVTITSNGKSKTLEVYSQGDQAYVYDKDSDKVYAVDKTEMDNGHASDYIDDKETGRANYHKDGQMTVAQEELLDFLVGDLKDNFELTKNSDGSETITFEMTNGEMPMLLNLMVSAADGQKPQNFSQQAMNLPEELLAKYPVLADMVDMKTDLPEIVDNMEIDHVVFQVTTIDGAFISASLDLELAGNDSDGDYHDLAISGDFELSNVGSTSVDKVELEGKEVITVDPTDFDSIHHKDMEGNVGRQGRR